MSFEYIIEKDRSTQVLTPELEAFLIKDISAEFVTLNSERLTNLDMASKLAN